MNIKIIKQFLLSAVWKFLLYRGLLCEGLVTIFLCGFIFCSFALSLKEDTAMKLYNSV
jgi:hypothetical protein